MDYQKYAFELLANCESFPIPAKPHETLADFLLSSLLFFSSTADLDGLTFDCGDSTCPYPSSLGGNLLAGRDVLVYLEIADVSYGKWSEFCFPFLSFWNVDVC